MHQVVALWSALPEDAADAETLHSFKGRQDV